MKRFSKALSVSMLVLASLAMSASADVRAPSKAALNQTPIVHQAACNGTTGRYGCGPGWVWRCDRWGHHCRCRRC